jgi:hypothetical protein
VVVVCVCVRERKVGGNFEKLIGARRRRALGDHVTVFPVFHPPLSPAGLAFAVRSVENVGGRARRRYFVRSRLWGIFLGGPWI